MKIESTDTALQQLIRETCQYPPQSLERQIGLTKIVQAIIRSGKLWQENTLFYEDALQQTWLYFCRNLCEANTGNVYDSSRGSVITWLDSYLKRRLQDYRIHNQQQEKIQSLDSNPLIQPQAPTSTPSMLEEVKEWVLADPEGKLSSLYLRGHPEVTAQVLLLRRLPPRTSWEKLAQEFNLPATTLSSFYQRQCFPRLRQFGKSQGYLS